MGLFSFLDPCRISDALGHFIIQFGLHGRPGQHAWRTVEGNMTKLDNVFVLGQNLGLVVMVFPWRLRPASRTGDRITVQVGP